MPNELPVSDADAPRTKIERDLAVERWIAEGEREFASLEEMLECTIAARAASSGLAIPPRALARERYQVAENASAREPGTGARPADRDLPERVDLNSDRVRGAIDVEERIAG